MQDNQLSTDAATDGNRLSDLIARLESATEGSRELSDEVLLACGWEYVAERGEWIWHYRRNWHEHYRDGQQPSPTESLDDAVALVPDGHTIHLVMDFANAHVGVEGRGITTSTAATPALAVTSACLRARS